MNVFPQVGKSGLALEPGWVVFMSEDRSAQWTVLGSKDAGRTSRTLLCSQGMRKGDLSKFIEDAPRWRAFDLTTQEVRPATRTFQPSTCKRRSTKRVPPRARRFGPCRINRIN